MKCSDWSFLVVSVLLVWFRETTASRIKFRKNNKDVYCGACLGLMDEMEWEIMKVSPKKTVQVGSFRVDPSGNQKLYKVPLARSELHLTEVLETVCSVMSKFAESFDNNARRKTYIRTSSMDGTAVSLNNVQISSETGKLLQFACETIIEEYEEELIPILQTKDDDKREQFCIETTDLCNARNVTDFKKKTSDAYAATIQAEADKRAQETSPQAPPSDSTSDAENEEKDESEATPSDSTIDAKNEEKDPEEKDEL